jgi:hypothetical protein
MKNKKINLYNNNNQVIINKLFPDDSMPTAIVYSSLLGPDDKPIIRYPKYMLWQRMLIVPYSMFEERFKSLKKLIESVDLDNDNPGAVMREEELIGFPYLEDIEEVLNPDLSNITSDDLKKLRDNLEQ